MANDLVTRLLLNTQQFDSNLTKSTQQVRQFQGKIDEADKNFQGFSKGLTGIGISFKGIGWAAAIAGAGQFAKMGIEATQMSDNFTNALAASKQTIDSLAGALITADFSTFNDGLIEAWKRSNMLAEAIDTLGDVLLSKKVFDSRATYEFNEALIDIRDTTLSIEQRQNALNRAREVNTGLSERNLRVQNQIRDVVEKTWIAETGQNITNEQIRNIAELGDSYDDLYGKVKTLDNAVSKSVFSKNYQRDKAAVEEARKALNGYSAEQITFARQWQKFNDEQRKGLADNLILENQIYQQQQQQEKTLVRAANSINKANNATSSASGGGITPKKEQIETMQQLNAAIEEARQKWISATDELQKYNAYLEYQKLIQTRNNVTQKEIQAPGLSTKGITNVFSENSDKYIEDLRAQKNANLEAANANYKLSESYGLTSQALGALASNVGSISDNPGIRALASSLAVLAAVQGVVEATGWIQKLVAIASLTAATVSMFSSLSNQKFAGGGIVGDRNIVRVNEGEMILNSRQQNRLFQQLSSGSWGNQSNQNISLVVRGEDLVGVQNNYNSKFRNNKKYGYIS